MEILKCCFCYSMQILLLLLFFSPWEHSSFSPEVVREWGSMRYVCGEGRKLGTRWFPKVLGWVISHEKQQRGLPYLSMSQAAYCYAWNLPMRESPSSLFYQLRLLAGISLADDVEKQGLRNWRLRRRFSGMCFVLF